MIGADQGFARWNFFGVELVGEMWLLSCWSGHVDKRDSSVVLIPARHVSIGCTLSHRAPAQQSSSTSSFGTPIFPA